MQTQNKIPQLRFPGFDGEWETKKIGQLLKIGSGKDYKHLNEGNVPVFGTGGLMAKVDKPLFSGETVFIGRKGSIDKPFYFNGDFWTVDTLFYTFSFNNSLPNFVYGLFQKINWYKHNEASGVPSLSTRTIETIFVNIPTLPEQEKIASFLSSVDAKILQLSRKATLLEQYKKGVMQQLFSGKLRFKDDDGGDYGDWDEKTIKDYFEIKAGGDIDSKNVSQIKNDKYRYPVYANSEKHKGFYGYSDIYKIDYDCITVTGRGSLGIANSRFEKFYPIVRLLILKPKGNNDVLFSEYALNRINIYSESTGVPQLTAPQYSTYKISFPCIQEQQKIATFLSGIDGKIALVKGQLEKTQEFKKGLLQGMFV